MRTVIQIRHPGTPRFLANRVGLGNDDSSFQTYLELEFEACIATVICVGHVVKRHAHGAADWMFAKERYLWKMQPPPEKPSALGKFSESVGLIQVLVRLEFPAPYADSAQR